MDNTPFDPQQEAPLLSAYVDAELEPADVKRIETHLAMQTDESRATQLEIDELRRFNSLTGAMRLKDPPAEDWEAFWDSSYNRNERSLGWLLLGLGLAVIVGWFCVELAVTFWTTASISIWLKSCIVAVFAGAVLIVSSVVRERIFARRKSRYKDVIR
ncbi:MAG: putative anti-sigma-YlaC factor YlaD [Candidatus Krumholzibacteriia bacterium]|jgi:predicted anti-sigma-YlaC factor YlaD